MTGWTLNWTLSLVQEVQVRTLVQNQTSATLDRADFKVFSDGSGSSEGIGAAAILYSKDHFTPLTQLKFSLGSPSKHNSFEAKLVEAILAIWLLNCCHHTVSKRASLYINNQAVLASLCNPKVVSSQYLVRHLRLLANGLACNHWISRHSKVRGNEKVNLLAKEAAEGTSSKRACLPHILRDLLPSSASATKQAYLIKLKRKWAALWEKSSRSQRMAEIDETFPFNGFCKRTNLLSRKQASLMAQIRCRHILLNTYLFRISRSETENCQACLNHGGHPPRQETINHFLFECVAYKEERRELVRHIGRSKLNLRNIMADVDRMKALAAYATRTGRFQQV